MNAAYNRILAKSLQLYKAHGVRSITMDDIARSLHMSKKTIYQYFSNKYELVKLCVNTEIDFRKSLIQDVLDKELNAIDEVFELNQQVYSWINENHPKTEDDLRELYPDLYNEILYFKHKSMQVTARHNIDKGMASGLYREDLNSEVISLLYIHSIMSFYARNNFTRSQLSQFEVVYEILNYHIRGMATGKGIAQLEEILQSIKATNTNQQ